MRNPVIIVDPAYAPPPDADLARSAERIRWEAVEWSHSDVDRFLDEVRKTHVNGGAHLARWRAHDLDDAARWHLTTNRYHASAVPLLLLGSPAFRDAMPQIDPPAGIDAETMQLEQLPWGAMQLDIHWASLLLAGGAYDAFRGPYKDALHLARTAANAVAQERYEQVRVDVSETAWADWFFDVAWDSTYVITDRETLEVTMLCVTDTD